ncbi:MAG TPA: ornithine--oxo-acid transaminase [Candidatus Baltobacteraceae bacterium]|jgi:ornithine--oxo-acid transaminase|nr:ornithine--oxo-acid transaminase [Candidatus Baltobacteraceae bacterium]
MHDIQDNARELIALEDRYGAHNYHPLDLVVERAEGVWLYDVNGKRYLDCISAYSAVNQGHCHPKIAAAMIEQAQKLTLTSRAMRNDKLPVFLKKLTELCGYGVALPMNTGVEAIETAIKLARRYGYRVKGIAPDRAEIVVFTNNFHGRTTAAISASSTHEYRHDFGPFTPGFVHAEYGNYDAVAQAINENTCAVLIEPIQGEGGVIVPPEGFLKRLWGLCREHRVLFVADEIQTGFGRAGDMFACDHEGIRPDVLVVGKALGGGFYPVSAALADAELMSLFRPGDHGSTFGGNPLGSAVAIAALDVLVDEHLASRARYAGAKIMQGLRAIDSPLVRQVRGRGLLIGVELTIPARNVSEALLERGIAAKDTHASVLRIAPPLVIEDAEIDLLISTVGEVLSTL